jgi:hypothetical protein
VQTFTYLANDGLLNSLVPATVSIAIVAPPINNLPPTTEDDELNYVNNAAGTSMSINAATMLTNDADPDDPAIATNGTVQLVSGTSTRGGTVSVSADGRTVTYTPPATVPQDDQFQYIAVDRYGAVSAQTASVKVIF